MRRQSVSASHGKLYLFCFSRQHCPHGGQPGAAAGLVRCCGIGAAAGKAQIVLAHLGDEARRCGRQKLAPLLAPLGVADMQGTPCARNADVHQPAFFFKPGRIERFTVRQHAFFDADQKYVPKLQALGRMQGGKLYGVRHAGAALLLAIEQIDQRDHLRQFNQRLSVLLAAPRQPLHQFLHVSPARLGRLALVFPAQPGFVTNGVEQVVHYPFDRLSLGALFEAVDEPAEILQGR